MPDEPKIDPLNPNPDENEATVLNPTSILGRLFQCKDNLPHLLEQVMSYLCLNELKMLSQISKELKPLADQVYDRRYAKVVKKLGIGNETNLINNVNQDGKSLLHKASEEGNLDKIVVLLEKGANVEQGDRRGRQPFHIAAMYGHYEAFKLLINQRQANIKAKTKLSSPVLIQAAIGGNIDLISYLISKGANVNDMNDNKYTVLNFATYNGHVEAIKLLLENGAQYTDDLQRASSGRRYIINTICHRYGLTALGIASWHGRLSIVNYLISCGANINTCEKCGYSPLSSASYKGNLEVAKVILANGADVEQADNIQFNSTQP